MTARAQAQCATCTYLRSPFNRQTPEGVTRSWCEAFPSGIPEAVWENRADHRKPVEGDHGVRWTPRDDDAVFPEDLLH